MHRILRFNESNDITNSSLTHSDVFDCNFQGDLLIIDPCYLKGGILSNEWQSFCKMSKSRGLLDINGVKLIYSSANFGDGTYYPEIKRGVKYSGSKCCVDSGLLCVILVDMIPQICDVNKINLDLGVIIKNFSGDVRVGNDGNIISTSFRVFTDGSHDSECYYCDGLGTIDCEHCSGHGEMECPECDGRGTLGCDECNGTGEESEVGGECEECDGGKVECDFCKGNCEVSCPECDGNCAHDCPECEGSGTRQKNRITGF